MGIHFPIICFLVGYTICYIWEVVPTTEPKESRWKKMWAAIDKPVSKQKKLSTAQPFVPWNPPFKVLP